MRNSWNIFSNDVKSISTNLVTAIIIGGLIFLPSLYAWLNIAAAWDPYGQTDQIPVGVVNEDIGEVIRDEEVDVGAELIDTLKDNDAMSWQFTERESAIEQLEKGDLFAVIIIPEDFSEKLGTVIQTHPEKANVEYYVNEKINAIAPKITEKGASVIVEDISSQFISTVNGIIFEVFNKIGLELEDELPDIKKFENYVFEMEERLPEIHETLTGTLSDASDAQGIVGKAKDVLPKADNVIGSGLDTIDNTNVFLTEAENRLNDIGPKINVDLANAQDSVAEINAIFSDIEAGDINFDAIESEVDKLENQVNESIDYVKSVEDMLQGVLKQMKSAETPNEKQIEDVKASLKDLQQIKDILIEGQKNTGQLASFINENEQKVDQIFEQMTDLSVRADDKLATFVKEYNETIEPTVLEEIKKAKETLLDARGMLVNVQQTIPEIDELLKRTSKSLDDGEDLLEEVLAEYPYVNDKVAELASNLRAIQAEADINEIIELLKNDPEAERGFLTEPVLLTENKVFPIDNYGSGMTPFYTVLSLWVGGLLLISILTTDVREPEQFRSNEVYFGKLFTFILIGFLQTLIVTSGDIFLINVEMANPFLFVLFGLFVSIVFMTIVYTFVSIFGDVGKAMAIIMLVLQIAGSGGTYPVVLLPKFFQTVSPFLPFTYAVNVMREAVGGIVWSNVLFDLMMLAIFGIIAIIFGTVLKEPINNQTNKLMDKSKKSDVFQ